MNDLVNREKKNTQQEKKEGINTTKKANNHTHNKINNNITKKQQETKKETKYVQEIQKKLGKIQMIRIKKQKLMNLSVIILMFISIGFLLVQNTVAIPAGATLTQVDNESNNGSDPGFRQDPGGVVVTLTVDVIQQNTDWKAYVGNVTGTLTLDDADNYTIYDWDVAVTSGEVYITRSTGIDFNTLNCSNVSNNINDENSHFGWGQSENDTVNQTFNWTTHASFSVGTNLMNENDCQSLYTFKSGASQDDDATSDFSEVVMADNSSVFAYVTLMETNTVGFDTATYDFQSIVPENGSNDVPTTYYFYVELGS